MIFARVGYAVSPAHQIPTSVVPQTHFQAFSFALVKTKGVLSYAGECAELLLLLGCDLNDGTIPTCSYKKRQ